MSELTELPESFAAGNTVVYRKRYDSYPVSGWTAKLILVGAVGKKEFAAAVSGSDFLFTLPATGGSGSGTDALGAGGVYSWVERVTATSGSPPEVHDVASGVVTVTPDLSSVTTYPGQHQERVIALCDARIEGRLSPGADNESEQLLGRAFSKIPLNDIYNIKRNAQAELDQIRNPGEFGIPVRFTIGRPS